MPRTAVALSRQETRVRTSEITHVGSLATIDSGSRATEQKITSRSSSTGMPRLTRSCATKYYCRIVIIMLPTA
ncbi:hypothetical protein K503DRAFT_318495 [Rhizopogon vinicolor AM-OR11-026]|uniref:Uncharacterized protein n=1 Tax=Rhizopogon vinicolor AM-OR11-026 TaxID=1314800 RepID=A0A1B7MUJ2_9AGAM|nr:hypothetical protein K503DRAFT_318495 [Rhizopogon vinicolor AM-OR11-026]